MNIFDITLLLLILVAGVISGLRKGFIHQIVSVIALIAGAYLAYCLFPIVSEALGNHVSWSVNVLNVIAFSVTFLGIYLVVSLIGIIVRKIISSAFGGWLDKFLGILFSTTKVVLVLGIFILLFDALNGAFEMVDQSTLDQSIVYVYIKKFTDVVFPFLKNLIKGGAGVAQTIAA